jgi:hypothetical protein
MQPVNELFIQLEKDMARIQLAPEIEFKMDIEIKALDEGTRDYDVQQHKKEILAVFNDRLRRAFPEGYRISSVQFGLDTGWHDELKLPGDDSPVVT